MASVLIIGANRGIGLGLVRQYVEIDWDVHATSRNPGSPGQLGTLVPPERLYELEVRDASQIERLAGAFTETSLDVLIHNAGVHDRHHTPEEVMDINAKAPFKVIEPLLPALTKAPSPKLVLMTSQLGARRGGTYSLGTYGDSKAALNDRFRALAPSWGDTGITAVVLHPGWVRTDMGGSSAPLSVEESASSIVSLIAQLGSRHHGGFWTWDGQVHPW